MAIADPSQMRKKRDKIATQIAAIEEKLRNDSFVARAPAEVVARERDRLAALVDELGKLDRVLHGLGGT